jgi:hypothetical protein
VSRREQPPSVIRQTGLFDVMSPMRDSEDPSNRYEKGGIGMNWNMVISVLVVVILVIVIIQIL